MTAEYKNNGYFLKDDFFERAEIDALSKIISEFHKTWIIENKKHYSKEAINAAYLTDNIYLTESIRIKLFEFLRSNKLMDLVLSTPLKKASFMNTQLFFNPVNSDQKNY